MAAVRVEHLHIAAYVVVAGDFVCADVRDYSADYLPVGQGRVLRLDMLVRRVGGNDGRYEPGKDATWTILEPAEYDRAGDFVSGVADRGVPIRQLDGAELGAWAHERATVFWNAQ